MLTRYRRQNVEGARLLVGERWDVRSQRWLPCYPDLIAHPRHTPPSTPAAAATAATAAAAATIAGSPKACSAPAATPPRAPRQHPLCPGAACRAHPLLRQRKGEWTLAADLLMMTNDDTR